MKCIIQRILSAEVVINNLTYSKVNNGLLVLVGFKLDDSEIQINKMIDKLLKLRIFNDEFGKMNLNVEEINGEILIVPNFTIYGDTQKGNRPSYTMAEKPEKAKLLFDLLINNFTKKTNLTIKTGVFQADMKVNLINDGPVTLILEI